MSYLSTARTAIIAKGAGVAGIRGAYVRLPEVIKMAPAIVLGQMSWATTPGDRESTIYSFELELWVERVADDDRTIATTDDLIDLIQSAYAVGITLAQIGTTQGVIRGGSSNSWETSGTAEYLVTRFLYTLQSTRQRGYTA